ncbi:TraR/DksA family transcriptional regulator [Rubrobacter taiwanensis]|nr:TraR/DksA family transcriptional regulator [Rubrobacter taiwanensis]
MANPELDQEFIVRQRKRLEQMREEILRMHTEQAQQEEWENLADRGDIGQHLHARQMEATVGRQLARRLENIERALQKIEEGTYGICDETGEPIPRGRLEAVPEAVYTIEAQRRRE